MAKKRGVESTKTNHNKSSFVLGDVDMELLTHKYADIYRAKKAKEYNGIESSGDTALDSIRKIGEEREDYIWYDTKAVYYPMYKTKVGYEVIKEQELHPIILKLLEIIRTLSTLKERDNIESLQAITQLDSEILASLLSDLETRGFMTGSPLSLTTDGKIMLEKRKEAIPQSEVAYILIDGIFGEVVEVAKSHKDIMLESRPPRDSSAKDSKNFIELKPSSKDLRPRIENLHKDFSENKTLYSVIAEALSGLDCVESEANNDITESKQSNTGAEITDITDIDPKKFFKKYLCLFYKSKDENRKILVLDSKHEIDEESTKLFEKFIRHGKL